MVTITNTIRWVDNTRELLNRIREGTDSIVAMKALVKPRRRSQRAGRSRAKSHRRTA